MKKKAIILACCLVWGELNWPARGWAQAGGQIPALTLSASFAGQESVTPDEPLELRLNRPLLPAEGRLAVLIGRTDLTGLFTATENKLQYGPPALPLPTGETALTVYLVTGADEWKELARFPLRVSTPAAAPPEAGPGEPAPEKRLGFDKLEIAPALNLGLKSQAAESHLPEAHRPARPTFTDGTLEGSLRAELARGPFNLQSQYDLVGSSFQAEALRFSEQGAQAPQVDLSNYLMQFQAGTRKLLVGQTSFGAQRHLISNFASRGVTLAVPLGPRADFALAALSGTSIVGWDNFFGVSQRRHRLVSGLLGFELLPQRPGGLRLEAGALSGWLLPLANFNEGRITDAERSQGAALRLIFADKSQRWRLEGGFTRSRFTNPADPSLDQGARLVPVRATTRTARYLDAGLDLLKDFTLSPTRQATLTLNLRHERVDPLFRSVAATAIQADRQQNQVELVGTLGEVAINLSHTRFNDNLADLPSILKTFTRQHAFAVSAPLAPSLSRDPAAPSPLLPRVAYTFDRLHQFAPVVPVNGGFSDPSTIPDQVSLAQTLTVEWQASAWRATYRLNHSAQDNRQPGRATADLRNVIHGVGLGWNPRTTLEVHFELNRESAGNQELRRTERTLRFGFGANWKVSGRASLVANLTTLGAGGFVADARASRGRNTECDLQWSWRWGAEQAQNKFMKVQTQWFIRYANRFARARDGALGVNTLTKLHTLNTGLNLIIF